MFKDRKQAIDTNPQTEINQTNTQQHADSIESVHQEKRANTISLLSAKIARISYKTNLAYTIITGLLFIATIIVLCFNIKAVNTADMALREQQTVDSFQRIANRVKDSTDSAKYIRDTIAEDRRDFANLTNQKALVDIQNKATQAQINAFQRQEERFETENESFLQVEEVDTTALMKQPTMLSFVLFDLGQPLKITHSVVVVRLEKKDAKLNEIRGKFGNDTLAFKNEATYVTKEAPQTVIVPTLIVLPNTTIQSIISGDAEIYFYGKYFYQDLITGRQKQYLFVIEFTPVGKKYRYLLSDNTP